MAQFGSIDAESIPLFFLNFSNDYLLDRKMKKTLITFLAMATLALTGCGATAKVNDELEHYKKTYRADAPVSVAVLTKRVDDAWEQAINEPSDFNDQVYKFLANELALLQLSSLKIEEVSRHFSVNWGNTGRGGAALREPAYVQTLGGIESNERLPRNRTYVQPVAIVDLTTAYSLEPGKGYSHYELSRWERYCNFGKGMDKRDWIFINQEGLHNMPSQLRVRCNHPK